MKNISQIFGTHVRSHRKRLRMTQEQLAEKCGKSLATIQLLESGKTWPEKHTIEKLCEVFDVADARLFEAEDRAESSENSALGLLRSVIASLAALNEHQLALVLRTIRGLTARGADNAQDSDDRIKRG